MITAAVPPRYSRLVHIPSDLWWRLPVIVGLWLVFFEWPYPPGVGLDSSWQQVLDNAWSHRRAFGADIAYTYGPWGFLRSPESTPQGFLLHLIFQIGAKLLLAIALVEFGARLRRVPRVMFLTAVALLAWQYWDATEIMLVAIVLFTWLLPDASTLTQIVLGGFVLGWLSLMKFPLFVLAGLSVATVAALLALEGRRTRAIVIAASYLCALAILWLSAGQRLADLREFLFLSGQISLGYSSAMYIDEPPKIFNIAVGLLVVHAVWLVWFARRDRPRVMAFLTTGYLALGMLLAWKLGITRGDFHVMAFFVYSVLLVAALPGLVPRAFSAPHAAAVILLAILGFSSVARANALGLGFWNPWPRIANASRQLLSFGEGQRRFEEAAAASAAQQQLPNVRAEVSDRSIDFLGDDQAIILFNGLNYRPRPIFQSYTVYTHALLKKNFDFIQSDRRPEYVLAELAPIDGRYGGTNDSWLTAELPRLYEPVLREHGLLLLKQRQPPPTARPLTLTRVYEREVAVGERVDLPADRTHALWLEVDARPTIAGRLRSALYKPAPLQIRVFDEFSDRPYRLVEPLAAAGMIVQLPLMTTKDLNAFVTGRVDNWIKAFAIETPAGTRYWRTLRVRLSRLEAISLTPVIAPSIFEEAGVTNLRPESIWSGVDWRVFEAPEPRLLLHAPGELRFRPPAGRRRLSGEFGILDGAYTSGATDGVEFSISVGRQGGAEQQVWRARLQPLTNPEDRGPHRFAVDLPADADLLVIVRTGPGPSGKIAWDWSYLSKLRFADRER